MGSTNLGQQIKSIDFNASAADYTFNIRNVGIIPTGIYQGGFLKIDNATNDPGGGDATNQSFMITPFVAEMLDTNGNYQVRVQTLTAIVAQAADHLNPYVMLSWVYNQALGANYIDVVLASSPATYPNGLLLGKCTFSDAPNNVLNGFLYTEYTGATLTSQRSVNLAKQHMFHFEFDQDLVNTRDVYIYPGVVPVINGANRVGTAPIGFTHLTIPSPGATPTNYIIYAPLTTSSLNYNVCAYISTTSSLYSLATTAGIVVAELIGVTNAVLTPSMYKDARCFVK